MPALGPLDLLDCGTRRAASGIPAPASRPPPPNSLPRWLKKALGQPPTWSAGSAPASTRRPWPARVEVDGKVVEGDALAVVVSNGGSFGGGRWLIPDTDVGDSLLDVLVVPADVSGQAGPPPGQGDRRLPADLPRLAGPEATVVTDMPTAASTAKPPPTAGPVTVIPSAWKLLARRES